MDTYKDISELTNDDIRGLEFCLKKKGLEFDSEEQAIQFYKSFAEFHGFVIRKDDVRRDDDGNIVVHQLVCNRAGTNGKNGDCGKVTKSTTRTDCQARLRVNLNVETGKWTVFAFDPSHNHPLTPAHYVHLIPKYRRLSESDKALVDDLHTQGVRTCHILGFMLARKGGYENLGFCKKDLYNILLFLLGHISLI
jgi:hypothetical protein